MKNYLVNKDGYQEIEKWEPNCWINIQCPTPDEMEYLVNTLNVPLAFLNDIEDIDERPRIEVEDNAVLIIIRIPYKNPENGLQYTTIPLGLVICDDILVTITYFKTELIPDLISYSQKKKIQITNNFDIVLRILLSSSVWYLKYLKQISLNIKKAEVDLEKSIKNQELQALFQIQKCLVFFVTSLKGNSLLFNKLNNAKQIHIKFDEDLLEDVDIELKQAIEMTNIYSDILTGMMDAYASVISNNLNVVMKQLTSISIILMIPTLIASLYGMNVPNLFEDNHYGFFIILFISFSISILGVALFIRKKWF